MPDRSRDGFALIAALGIMVAAAALALGMSTAARGGVRRTDAHVQVLRAEAITRVVALELIDAVSIGLASHAFVADAPIVLADTIDNVAVLAVASDLASRVNLNAASADGLRRFLVEEGIPDRAADIAAQSIVDWRDPDDLHHARGAEADWYHANGAGALPANRSIAAYDELRLVRGISPDVFAVLTQHGTLWGDGSVNANSAPLAVLASLPGVSREAAAAIVARRSVRPIDSLLDFVQAVPHPWRDPLEQRAAELAVRLMFTVQEIEIRIETRSSRAAVRTRGIVRHMGDGRMAVLDWAMRS